MNRTLSLVFCFALSAFSATNVYYSVGQTTADLKTGTPNIAIASGVATFTVAQTAVNMGVGDRVTYGANGRICYLKAKTSTTVWSVVTALGANPTDTSGTVAVTSIAHEYSSLSAAEAGASAADHLNTTNLVTGDFVLNLPCYYDNATDGTAVTVAGWTGDATRYIKIYTPYNTSTECNQSQRHSGIWSATKYNLTSAASYPLQINDDIVTKVEGLQIAGTGFESVSIRTTGGGTTEMSYCIVNGNNDGVGVRVAHTLKIWNSILYTSGAASTECLHTELTGAVIYAYNITCYLTSNAAAYAILSNNFGAITAKNCIAYVPSGGVALCYGTGINGTMTNTNCVSNDTTAANFGGSGNRESQTISFVNAAGSDFHLSTADTSSIGKGTDLSGDATIAVTDDIDRNSRPYPVGGNYDVGAHEVSTIGLGSYTVGTGGDFATWASAFSKISTLTGTLTLTQISNVTETAVAQSAATTTGQILNITSLSHGGNVNNGYWTTIGHNSNGFLLQFAGTGTVNISNLKIKRTVAGASVYDFNCQASAASAINFSNAILNGNKLTGSGLYIIGASPTYKVHNVLAYNYSGTAIAQAITVNAGNIFENVTTYNNTVGIAAGNFASTYRNCAMISNTNGFTSVGSATGRNNASTDATGEDADFSVGSGNVASVTAANEFHSLDTLSAYFMKVNAGASCDNGGTTPVIVANTTGIRGNARPGADAAVSIGADELWLPTYDTTYRDTILDSICLSLDSLVEILSDTLQRDSMNWVDTTAMVGIYREISRDTTAATYDTVIVDCDSITRTISACDGETVTALDTFYVSPTTYDTTYTDTTMGACGTVLSDSMHVVATKCAVEIGETVTFRVLGSCGETMPATKSKKYFHFSNSFSIGL